MPEVLTFKAWAESLDGASYYGVLRVPQTASPDAIKMAFHAFALRCHPDRYVDESEELADAASEVFKRGVEAYNVLSKPDLRTRYDDAMRAGRLRMDPHEIPAPKVAPAAPKTLEELAKTDDAKSYARRADLLLSVGRAADALAQLTSACSLEPTNRSLLERLRALGGGGK